jgi:hypothetical protein
MTQSSPMAFFLICTKQRLELGETNYHFPWRIIKTVEMVTSIHAGIFNLTQREITFHFISFLCVVSTCKTDTNTLPSTLCGAYSTCTCTCRLQATAQHELILPSALTRMHENIHICLPFPPSNRTLP